MHRGFVRLILACERFPDLSTTGRLSTSLILQFAGWNSRPCFSLPPPNNGNPLSTSYWPTTWLIKTCLESRRQLTVKPIKPNSAPKSATLAVNLTFSWGTKSTLLFLCLFLFFSLPFGMLRISNSKCHIQYFRLWDQPLVKSIHRVSNGLCCLTWKISNFARQTATS